MVIELYINYSKHVFVLKLRVDLAFLRNNGLIISGSLISHECVQLLGLSAFFEHL